MNILGIHHVTAMCGAPQPNIDFYTKVLGQRMVKVAVNFDDPGTYHLYYGDAEGTQGSILTFFPWEHAEFGPAGPGLASAVAYPTRSLAYWQDRLAAEGIGFDEFERFGQRGIALPDPDGMIVEIIEAEPHPQFKAWTESDVPIEHALLGFHSVTFVVEDVEESVAFLEKAWGFRVTERTDERVRMATAEGGAHQLVDFVAGEWDRVPRMGKGQFHHVAYRVADDAAESEAAAAVNKQRIATTDVKDRNYFHSVYFREPGGVLFEIATDGPGWTVDEKLEDLGTSLRLPPWYEPKRDVIEARLAVIRTPSGVTLP